MNFGVIGGTGFYTLTEGEEEVEVATAYGPVRVNRTAIGGVEVAFIARHGSGHAVPPHRVNYRGNVTALKELGITNILASASVGAMSDAMPPGSLVIITQFLDFTKSRANTFYDGEGGDVVHTDMTDPYCLRLRRELSQAAVALDEGVLDRGTYVCAEGPRFETPAEIEMFRRMGGDIVGMTNVPEVVLAREAGICYAAVAAVTNWAAGIAPEPLKHEEVSGFMETQTPRLRALFEHVIAHHDEVACACRRRA